MEIWSIVNSFGLILDIIWVYILYKFWFFINWPILVAANYDSKKDEQNEKLSKYGIMIVISWFILQIISNFI